MLHLHDKTYMHVCIHVCSWGGYELIFKKKTKKRCFMACLMLGSACLGPLSKRFAAENYLRSLFAISALTMAVRDLFTIYGVCDY